MSPRTRIQHFTDECVVYVLPEDVAGNPIAGGSGFFVAPGVIVTCAHVVSSDGRAVRRAKVRWDGVTYEGTAIARPWTKGNARVWDPPDLCVITLDRTPPGQPSVVLGELGDADGHELSIAGYNQVWGDVQFQNKPGTLGGSQELATQMVREIIGPEIASGMSGGPVLDMRRGFICGVTKAQRKPNDNQGGLFIPAEFIQLVFRDEAWLPNRKASAANKQWHEQRDAVLDEINPAAFRLKQEERDLLDSVEADLGLTTKDFTRLWGDVVQLPQQREFVSLIDVIADLANLMSNGLDPITKVFVWLACRDGIAADSVEKLLAYARRRDTRQRLSIVEYEKSLLERTPAPRNPVLVVRLRPDPPSAKGEFKLDIWRYVDRQADKDPVPILTDEGPYGLLKARKVIINILNKQVRITGGQPVIEFALPDGLLDLPVEEWDAGNKTPLGEKFPVVVRLAEREIDGISYVETLQARAAQFRDGSMPLRETREWDGLWLTCQNQYTPRELNRFLQRSNLPMIAMTAWHGRGRALKAIKAVKEAGVPVIVWRHKQCAEAICAAGGGGGACPGTRFKQVAADTVAGERLTVLPDRILAARIGQPSDDALGYQSPGIALIWDDPGLLPWVAGTPNLYPSRPAGVEDVEQLADLPGRGQPARRHPSAAPAAGMAGVRPRWVPRAPREPRA